MSAFTVTPSQVEVRNETAIAPLLAAHQPESLPSAYDLYVLANRVGLWELMQSARDLATTYECERFRVSIVNMDDPDGDPEWALSLCLKAQDVADESKILCESDAGEFEDLDEELAEWRSIRLDQLLVDPLPSGFAHQVLNHWLDPQCLDEVRAHVFGSATVALWRQQGSLTQDAPAPTSKRPRSRA